MREREDNQKMNPKNFDDRRNLTNIWNWKWIKNE
jgi:hypothetical protein